MCKCPNIPVFQWSNLWLYIYMFQCPYGPMFKCFYIYVSVKSYVNLWPQDYCDSPEWTIPSKRSEALDAATTLRLGSPTSLGRASCLRSILSPLHANLSRDFAPKLCFLAVPSRVYCPVGFLWSEWTFLGQKYPRAVTGPPGSNSIPPVWPGGPFQRFSFFGGTCV